jgi:hypothetical protein
MYNNASFQDPTKRYFGFFDFRPILVLARQIIFLQKKTSQKALPAHTGIDVELNQSGLFITTPVT